MNATPGELLPSKEQSSSKNLRLRLLGGKPPEHGSTPSRSAPAFSPERPGRNRRPHTSPAPTGDAIFQHTTPEFV